MLRFLLAVLVIAAFTALHAANSDDAPSGQGTGGAVATRIASLGAAGASTTVDAFQRARLTIGRAVGWGVGPIIRGMTDRNASDAANLQPAMRRANSVRRDNVLGIDRRRIEADSLALAKLHEGRPIDALRYALKGGSLVDAMRHQLAEELIR